MSDQEKELLIGQTVQALLDAKKELACFESKATEFAKRFHGAATAMSDLLDMDFHYLDEFPTREEAQDVFGGVRRNRNRIKLAKEKLDKIAPSWNQ